MSIRILKVAGARPNFMKVGPVHRALGSADTEFDSRIVHTGQHYDEEMTEVFFRKRGLPEPDVHLGVGSASHAVQTARIMGAFEPVVEREDPDLVVVVGDVNSTVACGLVAAKMHVPVAHVEAGLWTFDRRMSEESNRLLTDRLSRFLFVTERSGVENLRREGAEEERIHLVGNVVIDSLVQFREKAAERSIRTDLGLADHDFVVVTMHRPSNVDDPEPLLEVVQMVELLAASRPVVFPMHPRTRERLTEFDLSDRVDRVPGLKVIEPLGYLDFVHLIDHASVVVTDSGGVQEETTYLQVPCLTVRESTERPATVEMGTNELVTLDAETVCDRVDAILAGARPCRADPTAVGRQGRRQDRRHSGRCPLTGSSAPVSLDATREHAGRG